MVLACKDFYDYLMLHKVFATKKSESVSGEVFLYTVHINVSILAGEIE